MAREMEWAASSMGTIGLPPLVWGILYVEFSGTCNGLAIRAREGEESRDL